MNALAQIGRDIGRALSAPENPVLIRRRLADVIELYDNEDCVSRDWTVEAIVAGRPAFWTSATYHSQRACNLHLDVVAGASIQQALEAHYPVRLNHSRESALDTLIPLDRRAAAALSQAYADLGIWRDDDELELRRTSTRRRGA
jgi:hypothetical protein